MSGIALTVLINQLPKVFGVSIERDGPLRNLWRTARSVLDGQANVPVLAVGAGTLVVILVLKRFKRVPGILIAVVAATIAAGAFDLSAAGLKVLGPLPQGLPSFAVPLISFADLGAVVIGGCAVALVSLADTSVLSRTYAAHDQTRSEERCVGKE